MASFGSNNITTLAALPGTTSILRVSFDRSGIEHLEPGIFESTVNVTYVDFSYNFLTAAELAPDVFKGPYDNNLYEPIKLRVLNLAYNQIHSLQKDVFEHTPYLEELNLEGNQFRVIDQVTQLAISDLGNLRVLNLARNRLVDVPSNLVKNLKGLREVDLSRNRLDFVPETLDSVGESLEKLNVDDNPIIELTDSTFVAFKNLREVSLCKLSELRSVKANTFAPLRKLKILRLCDNELLEEIDREAFGPGQIIPEVYLSNNKLKDLDFNLLPWANLSVFEMKGNDFYCTCDLYNISTTLPKDITRNRDGPHCTDTTTFLARQVYSLQIDVCLNQVRLRTLRNTTKTDPFQYPGNPLRPLALHDHFNVMRVSLVTLSVILILSTMVALLLGWARWNSHRRAMNYPFVSNIAYNPLQDVHM